MSKTTQTLTNLRDLPNEELQQALAKTRDDLFRLQLGQYTNQVTSTAQLTSKRREIARIMTILRARQLGNEQQAAASASASAETAAAEAPATKKSRTKKAKS